MSNHAIHQNASFVGPEIVGRKVAVAMSGGVDSSVTAALLQRAGARVEGVFMRLAQPAAAEHQRRAQAVADRLGIELTVLELGASFQEQVLQPFVRAYGAGLTPNPCVCCNRLIKFGLLLANILERGNDFLATGHYARLTSAEPGQAAASPVMALRRGLDAGKDQSYFLCRLDAAALPRLLFPLGGLHKSEVYELAAEFALADRHGPESQDVCFLGDQPLADFLAARLTEPGREQPAAGAIVDGSGRELGCHRGIHRYTVGQRRGLGLPAATPYYVVALEAARNRVVVGKAEELWRTMIRVRDLNWLCAPPPLPASLAIQLRHRHQPAPATVTEAADGSYTLTFAQPQRAPAPGQYAALYQGDRLCGGGEII